MRFKLTLFLLTITFFSFAKNPLQPDGYVSDFAGLLKPGQEAKLEQIISDFEKKTSIEMAVVTVKSLNGNPIDKFTVELAEDWGVGKKGLDNGLVLLIAPNERKWWNAVGYGLEEHLTDAYTKSASDRILPPAFKQKMWFDGIYKLITNYQNKLGATSWGDRQAVAAELKRQREIEAAKSQEAFVNFITWVGILGALGFIIYLIYRGIVSIKNRRIREAKEAAEAKEKLDKRNEENVKFVDRFEKRINELKKYTDKHPHIKASEEALNLMRASIMSKALSMEGAKFTSDELRQLADDPLNKLGWVIDKYKELEQIKENISSGSLKAPLMTYDDRLKRFNTKNQESEYTIEYSRNKINSSCAEAWNDFNNLVAIDLTYANLSKLSRAQERCRSSQRRAEHAFTDIERELNSFEDARDYVKAKVDTIPNLIKRMHEICKHEDVDGSTRQSAGKAEIVANRFTADYTKEKVRNSKAELSEALTRITDVIRFAQRDIDAVIAAKRRKKEEEERKKREKRRREQRRRDEEAAARRRRRNSYSSSSSSSYSSGSSFGGGSFGGGGSGGSW